MAADAGSHSSQAASHAGAEVGDKFAATVRCGHEARQRADRKRIGSNRALGDSGVGVHVEAPMDDSYARMEQTPRESNKQCEHRVGADNNGLLFASR
jgi:hypothetical protein